MVFAIRPGHPRSPVILHVPHASRELTPAARASIGLDDAALTDELDHLTDAHTDLIAGRAADASAVRPWIFINGLSRLVVDPERFPDEREEMRAAYLTEPGGPPHTGLTDVADALTALIDAVG